MQKPNSCFLHIPKSGGTALVHHLSAVLGESTVFHAGGSPYINAPLTVLLSRFPVVTGHFSFAQMTDALLSTTFLFTFLREPADRILSLYHFLREAELRPESDPIGDLALAKVHPLAELLAGLPVPMRPSAWSNDQTFLLSGARSYDQPAEELLPTALRNLERLDFVGLHEDYDAGVRHLGGARGWPLQAPPRFKVTRDRPTREEVDPALLAEILRFNSCDVQLYARARELWEATRQGGTAVSPPAAPAPAAPLERNIHAFAEHGNKQILITKVSVRGQLTDTVNIVEHGDRARIILSGHSAITEDDVTVGIRLIDELGVEVYGVNTRMLGHQVSMTAGQDFEAVFTVDMILAPGGYYLTAALHAGSEHQHKCYHWLDNALVFECRHLQAPRFSGVADLKASFASSP